MQIIGVLFRENCSQYVRTSSSGKMSHIMLCDKQKWIKKGSGVLQKLFQKDPLQRLKKKKKDRLELYFVSEKFNYLVKKS